MIDKDIFEDLFVLEMANNHLGDVERGLKIIGDFAQVVRFNNVRATIKLQLRDVDSSSIGSSGSSTIRYIKKTLDTRLTARISQHGAGDSRSQLHPNGDPV